MTNITTKKNKKSILLSPLLFIVMGVVDFALLIFIKYHGYPSSIGGGVRIAMVPLGLMFSIVVCVIYSLVLMLIRTKLLTLGIQHVLEFISLVLICLFTFGIVYFFLFNLGYIRGEIPGMTPQMHGSSMRVPINK